MYTRSVKQKDGWKSEDIWYAHFDFLAVSDKAENASVYWCDNFLYEHIEDSKTKKAVSIEYIEKYTDMMYNLKHEVQYILNNEHLFTQSGAKTKSEIAELYFDFDEQSCQTTGFLSQYTWASLLIRSWKDFESSCSISFNKGDAEGTIYEDYYFNGWFTKIESILPQDLDIYILAD